MSWLDGNSNHLAYLIFRHRKLRILHILVKIRSKWFTTWLQEESMNKEQYYTSSECQQHLHKQNHWETQDWCPPEIINSRLSKSIRKQDSYGYVECLNLLISDSSFLDCVQRKDIGTNASAVLVNIHFEANKQ